MAQFTLTLLYFHINLKLLFLFREKSEFLLKKWFLY